MNFELFYSRLRSVLLDYNIINNVLNFHFSNSAISIAKLSGDYTSCLIEFKTFLESSISKVLNSNHFFINRPYIRRFDFENGKCLKIAIINNQSLEWYGNINSSASFDFLIEDKAGFFKDSTKFLDLGGHQMIWAIYYASISKLSKVISFEPSLINVLIGLFNCLINDKLECVDIVPFAVSVEKKSIDSKNMLVDFMNIPIQTVFIDNYLKDKFDFIKTDIEGYEYELLLSHLYIQALLKSKSSHFELHLGHLIKRGITKTDCINRLRYGGIVATEFYSGIDMYEYLNTCDPESYPAFLINN